MKKYILLSILLLFTSIAATPALGYEVENSSQDTVIVAHSTEYISDDLYVDICIEVMSDTDAVSTASTSTTKIATKSYTLRNSNSEDLAKYSLTGKFTYNGSTVSCISATYSTTVYFDTWKFTDASASYSGNVATGQFTAKHYFLFVPTQTISRTLTLTCDKNGYLS